MSIKIEKLENNVVKLEIAVDAETFEHGMEKSYKKNAQSFNIPGFRKGKAPRKIIEKAYGEGVFYEDAINIVCSKAYEESIEKENIDVIDTPEVDIIQIGTGKELIFTAKVSVKPEVILGDYKGLEVEKKAIIVSEEQVQIELDKMLEKNSRMINIDDRAVVKDDIVDIDFEGFIDGVAFDGGKGENYPLTIGSGQFIPGFEDQLIGANIGDLVEVKVPFPTDYQNVELAGKDSLFKAKINTIKVKELPALDDEFAKDVSEFDTLDELKNDIKQKLEEQAKSEQINEIENELVKIASENSQMEVPEVMINNQINSLEKDFDMRLKYQGLDLKKYMELTGSSVEDFKASLRPQAIDQVKGRLTLEAIAKAENLSATPEEIEEEIVNIAANYKQEVEHFKSHLRPEDLRNISEGIVFNKAIEVLVENSNSKTSTK